LILPATQFAADSSSSGISSLGINLKSFVFQLITFLIVLLILRRWVFPKLVATLEERRKTLEQSLEQARLTEETLNKAESQAAELLQKARAQADTVLADANDRVEDIIAKGETAAAERAARIIKDAEEHLDQERQRLHSELREELADLVADATEKVLQKKVNEREDRALIEHSLKEIG
jgi:F-type H+-transporting ATPase subunit b